MKNTTVWLLQDGYNLRNGVIYDTRTNHFTLHGNMVQYLPASSYVIHVCENIWSADARHDLLMNWVTTVTSYGRGQEED